MPSSTSSPINTKRAAIQTTLDFVRAGGLEPPLLSKLDPKSSAATNYATRALTLQSYNFSLTLPNSSTLLKSHRVNICLQLLIKTTKQA